MSAIEISSIINTLVIVQSTSVDSSICTILLFSIAAACIVMPCSNDAAELDVAVTGNTEKLNGLPMELQ
ncbi:MAG: hypothetical protein ACK53Y_03880, partial [bacterium]